MMTFLTRKLSTQNAGIQRKHPNPSEPSEHLVLSTASRSIFPNEPSIWLLSRVRRVNDITPSTHLV